MDERNRSIPQGMPLQLAALLEELERFGNANDAAVADYARKMLNITPDTGQFLVVLVRALRARHLLEIGTSNGYSTLWLAYAAQRVGGRITTLEIDPVKAEMARENFARSGLQVTIDLYRTDAGEFLRAFQPPAFDFIFLDSNRKEYIAWWSDLQRALAPGGLLVVDNVISHPLEVAPFRDAVERTLGYITSLVPVGKGELLILKDSS